MTPVIIGISSGILTILLIGFLKLLDTKVIYGLILSGIGFLYVGFVWTDVKALVINAIQAIVFLLLAYYGVKRSSHILAAGYFLHGCWDMLYNFLATPGLIPPHYDWFCFSIDLTICIYLLFFNKRLRFNKIIA
ncbi:MAG: DUF6010 family protein [Chitinophagaceae bacterium]